MEIDVFRDQLGLLENRLGQLPQTETVLTHHFAEGVYGRELFIPADTIVIGKRHRHSTLNIVLSGSISIYMGPGVPTKRIDAPAMFVSPPGSKKLGYTHSDTVFVNVHPASGTDLGQIENEVIIPEDESGEEVICLG
jgi:hypothetical protein